MIKMDLLLQGKNKYAQYKILLKFMPIKPCFFSARGTIEDGPYGGTGGIPWTDGGEVHLNG